MSNDIKIKNTPLLNKQKEGIWQLWKEYCQEDSYHRTRSIVEYCTDNECNIFSTCEYLIEKLKKCVCITCLPLHNRDYVENDDVEMYIMCKNVEYNISNYSNICEIKKGIIEEDIALLAELITNGGLHENPNRAKPKNRASINFSDYLLKEDGKQEILNKLESLFKQGKTGKPVATILIALHKSGWIILKDRGKQGGIYNAINHTYGLQLKNQSYQRYIKFNNNGIQICYITDDDISNIIEKLS